MIYIKMLALGLTQSYYQPQQEERSMLLPSGTGLLADPSVSEVFPCSFSLTVSISNKSLNFTGCMIWFSLQPDM